MFMPSNLYRYLMVRTATRQRSYDLPRWVLLSLYHVSRAWYRMYNIRAVLVHKYALMSTNFS